MTLNQCTKEELIFIINKMARQNSFTEAQARAKIDGLISDVVYRREIACLDEAEKWNKISTDCRKKAIELLKLYDFRNLHEIPFDIFNQAQALMEQAQTADEKWEECIKKMDAKRGAE